MSSRRQGLTSRSNVCLTPPPLNATQTQAIPTSPASLLLIPPAIAKCAIGGGLSRLGSAHVTTRRRREDKPYVQCLWHMDTHHCGRRRGVRPSAPPMRPKPPPPLTHQSGHPGPCSAAQTRGVLPPGPQRPSPTSPPTSVHRPTPNTHYFNTDPPHSNQNQPRCGAWWASKPGVQISSIAPHPLMAQSSSLYRQRSRRKWRRWWLLGTVEKEALEWGGWRGCPRAPCPSSSSAPS